MSARRKRKVLRLYDTTARSYWKLYGKEQLLKYRAALAKVELKASYTAVDVGCGMGRLVKRLSRSVGLAVGVDGSIGMLKRGASAKPANTCLVQADADYLPFRSEAFHALFSITLIQNLPNPRQTLNECYRVVKCKGVAVISVPKKDRRVESLTDALTKAKFISIHVVKDRELADVFFFCAKA